MNESFIHYLWQFQYFSKAELRTTEGETIRVFSPGMRNSDAGPDFLNARIQIGDIQWIGSVEIHIDASGWYQHGHVHDDAYANVILHVVWTDNTPVKRTDGSLLPTLVIAPRVENGLIEEYRKLVNSIETVPCASALPSVPELTLFNTMDKALSTRLECKAREILKILERNRGDWDETCYQVLSRNFGFKVNADPFFQLARSVPYKTLMKHSDKLVQLEAILFGVAGFLEDQEDDEYYLLLQREFNLLRQKYRLDHKMMNKVQWKFLRLRPANFPTLRIAQMAAFLHHRMNFFSSFLEVSFTELRTLFDFQPSSYWLKHYNFASVSESRERGMGDFSIGNIMINTVAPLLAAYSIFRDDQVLMDKALIFLQSTPPESNKITRLWEATGVKSRNAFDSQALLELYNNFCSRHRCLDCNIGASLIRPSRN